MTELCPPLHKTSEISSITCRKKIPNYISLINIANIEGRLLKGCIGLASKRAKITGYYKERKTLLLGSWPVIKCYTIQQVKTWCEKQASKLFPCAIQSSTFVDIWILEGFFYMGKASLSKAYYNMYLALFRIIKLITQGKKEEEERGRG